MLSKMVRSVSSFEEVSFAAELLVYLQLLSKHLQW